MGLPWCQKRKHTPRGAAHMRQTFLESDSRLQHVGHVPSWGGRLASSCRSGGSRTCAYAHAGFLQLPSAQYRKHTPGGGTCARATWPEFIGALSAYSCPSAYRALKERAVRNRGILGVWCILCYAPMDFLTISLKCASSPVYAQLSCLLTLSSLAPCTG